MSGAIKANLFLQTHSYSLYTFPCNINGSHIVSVHYYATEALDTQLFQLMLIHYSLFIEHLFTGIRSYCSNVAKVSVFNFYSNSSPIMQQEQSFSLPSLSSKTR